MGHRGTTGEEAASGFSHFFCCFNVCVVETPHVDHRRRVFLCSLTTHPLRSMPPCSGAWVACLGAHPCSSRGHTSNQQCRTPQPTKTGRNGAGRRERAIPHLLGIAWENQRPTGINQAKVDRLLHARSHGSFVGTTHHFGNSNTRENRPWNSKHYVQ
jgi:hypothetical protein